MKTETLQKANELSKKIEALKKTIFPLSLIGDEEAQKKAGFNKGMILSISVHAYGSTVQNIDSTIPSIEQKDYAELIEEEIRVCLERIERAIQKDIKKLEKEFESL